MWNGTRERPERPSYSFRSMGYPGISSILNAQSKRAMARKVSRSATHIPGQIRRLQSEVSSKFPKRAGLCLPHPEHPMVPFHGIRQVRRFRRKGCIIDVAVRLFLSRRQNENLFLEKVLTLNLWGSGCLWGSWCIVYYERFNYTSTSVIISCTHSV